jgi:hypothetical protein
LYFVLCLNKQNNTHFKEYLMKREKEDPNFQPFRPGDKVIQKSGENPFATWHEASKGIVVSGGVCEIYLIRYSKKLGQWLFTIKGRGELGEFAASQFEEAWGCST